MDWVLVLEKKDVARDASRCVPKTHREEKHQMKRGQNHHRDFKLRLQTFHVLFVCRYSGVIVKLS